MHMKAMNSIEQFQWITIVFMNFHMDPKYNSSTIGHSFGLLVIMCAANGTCDTDTDTDNEFQSFYCTSYLRSNGPLQNTGSLKWNKVSWFFCIQVFQE